MQKHVDVLAILHIIFGGLGLLGALIVLLTVGGSGILSGDAESFAILSLIATAAFSLIAILSLPQLIGGIFLLKRRNWARILILVVSFFNLFNIPVGTALGIYGIWVLMIRQESAELFA